MSEHRAQNFGSRVICSCGDFNCAALDYAACGFAVGRGLYCRGDDRFPDTHYTLCPKYVSLRERP